MKGNSKLGGEKPKIQEMLAYLLSEFCVSIANKVAVVKLFE